MEIEEKKLTNQDGKNVIVFKPKGRLDITTSWEFSLRLKKCISNLNCHIVVNLSQIMHLDSRYEAAQPGSLGMCLYTYRVRELNQFCDRITASSIQKFTTVATNEFGEPSFSFVAPDGYFWNLIGN